MNQLGNISIERIDRQIDDLFVVMLFADVFIMCRNCQEYRKLEYVQHQSTHISVPK